MAAPSVSRGDPRLHILLVVEEVLLRVEMSTMLEEGGFRAVPVAGAEEALEVLAAVPHIKATVTDAALASSGMSGFALAKKVHDEWKMGVLVVSGHAALDHTELPLGVHFVAKPVHRATLLHLVRDLVAVGSRSIRLPRESLPEKPRPEPKSDRPLTLRQQAVLRLLVQGKSNRDIALALDLSEHTVKVHLAAIFRTLGVSSRLEAVLAGMRFSPDDEHGHQGHHRTQ